MSRLFAVARTIDEIAAHFGVDDPPTISLPTETETVEGRPGLIVFERDGRRLLKSMPWGFPRHTRECAWTGKRPAGLGWSRTSQTRCGNIWSLTRATAA
ncbi:hypothetical protein SAMN05216228_100621 [Rhizobium tibeticum]|uniref:Uncharacterized protein n=1 Tax=Rhizobium tibeticum TaxID=501024 RepID=A0A1H8I6Z2_9HYPH|nr:hypothetical protein RTCCBAU85039_1811 [Rhizobium tibeticum]SEN63937.1 hypothetical protein SAMN05216228_100621 [Rhizobium tibeticum]